MSADNFSFPSHFRLKTAADYSRVFADPVKSSDQYFTVLARNNGLTHPRLGLAIAKKQVKKAVARNRIKRAARENFRQQKQQLTDIDVVVLARMAAATAPVSELSKSLEKHWIRLVKRCGSCSSP